MLPTTEFHLLVLKRELDLRKSANPRYSLRAYARDLGVDSGLLSRVMKLQRPMTMDLAQRIAAALALEETERDLFLRSAAARQGLRQMLDNGLLKGMQAATTRQEIDVETFAAIREVHHYAILELTFAKDFDSTPEMVAQRLGITRIEAELAIRRLLTLGLLRFEDGRLVKTAERITTGDRFKTAEALQERFREVLRRAGEAIATPPEERSLTAMTICIAPEKLAPARQLIQEFTERLCEFLEDGAQQRVYELAICLFSLEKTRRGKPSGGAAKAGSRNAP